MNNRIDTNPKITSESIKLIDFSKYKQPNLPKAGWQIFNSIVPYLGMLALMIILVHLEFPYWAVLPLSAIAAGFQVRLFIIFHDCCHRSYFTSPTANRIVGHILGILTFTPYEEWRFLHLKHHGSAGNLDRRGMGDIWTMTVEEYLHTSGRKKLLYRLTRNPLVMLGIGPILYFVISQRFWHKHAENKQKFSVLITNFSLLLILAAAHFAIGITTYLMIQLPIMIIAGAMGIWLFYVQHQFEGVYWERKENWSPIRAAFEGSSYYKLPKVLQWVSGNIGFHHIHHIRPQVPNYHLQDCFNENPELQDVGILTLRKSVSSLFLHLWNEQQSELISFRKMKSLQLQRQRT